MMSDMIIDENEYNRLIRELKEKDAKIAELKREYETVKQLKENIAELETRLVSWGDNIHVTQVLVNEQANKIRELRVELYRLHEQGII